MEHTNLATVYYNSSEDTLGSTRAVPLSNARECWQRGYDIKLDGSYLICDENVSRTPVNAATFLYSLLVPYGSYVNDCTGILVTMEENDQKYLYATCGLVNVTLEGYPQKLNITDCDDMDISYDTGLRRLICSEPPTNLPNGVGRFLPPGNYLITCTSMRFSPCGAEGRGLLEASCTGVTRNYSAGKSLNIVNNPTRLTGDDEYCSVNNMGYISNINGELVCDPSFDFHSATEESNNLLMNYFQCQ